MLQQALPSKDLPKQEATASSNTSLIDQYFGKYCP